MSIPTEAGNLWSPETQTNLRYTLADPELHIRDAFMNHAAGKVRVIEYPTPQGDEARIFDELYAAGLVLGTLLPADEDDQSVRFMRIPGSARPLIHDSVSEAGGAFSYGDDMLFYDLGDLLGRAVNLKIAVDGDIGRAVAFVEFTHPAERRVLFQPGIEHRTHRTAEEEIVDDYAARLSLEFGPQFDNVEQYFRMGVNEAQAS